MTVVILQNLKKITFLFLFWNFLAQMFPKCNQYREYTNLTINPNPMFFSCSLKPLKLYVKLFYCHNLSSCGSLKET